MAISLVSSSISQVVTPDIVKWCRAEEGDVAERAERVVGGLRRTQREGDGDSRSLNETSKT